MDKIQDAFYNAVQVSKITLQLDALLPVLVSLNTIMEILLISTAYLLALNFYTQIRTLICAYNQLHARLAILLMMFRISVSNYAPL